MESQVRTALLLLACMLVVLLATALLYWGGLGGGFMLDDGPNIVQSWRRHESLESVLYTITHNGSGLLGRSVAMLSFVLSGLQYGLDAWGFKYHNLMLHLLTGVLLFRLLHGLLLRMQAAPDQQRTLLVAGLVATLWLLHPLQVSTVLYVVQRMAQLASFFTILALLAWMQARTHLDDRPRYLVFGWVLFPLCTLLAALSKETGALVPLFVLAIEVFVFRTTFAQIKASRALQALLLVFVLLPLLLGALALLLKFESLTNYSSRTFTLGERLLTQVHVLFFYVRLILLPRIRSMGLFHDDFPVTSSIDLATMFLLSVMVLTLVLVWRLRRTYPVAAFGVAWFLIAQLMESTIFPLELVFEHRNYLAMAGLLLIPVDLLLRFGSLRPVLAGMSVVIALLAVMTHVRSDEWGEPELFHLMAVTEHPNSPRALNNYVNVLIGKGEYEKVLEQLERQMVLNPFEPGARMHMLIVRCEQEEKDQALLDETNDLLGRYPASVYAQNALQLLVQFAVESRCPALSIDDVERLLDTALAFPGNQANPHTQASLMRLRGLVALGRGFYAQAYAWFMMAYELRGSVELLTELMKYQLDVKRFDDAEETMVLVEQRNAERFGLEQYQVSLARRMLEDARLRSATDAVPADNGVAQ
jgi:tetratricopeptide (TPR) repeat protein